MSRALALDPVGPLLFEPGPDSPPHLAAASGLVVTAKQAFVIADDDLHLGVFPLPLGAKGRAVRLLPGRLPDEKDARKLLKPDFEVLLRLPSLEGYEHGALLALGSGSTRRRGRAVLSALTAEGGLDSEMTELVDFTPVYVALEQSLPELNIEGAVVTKDALVLLQRGNGARGQNALVSLELAALLRALGAGEPLSAGMIRAITPVQLGELSGVPLGFTDALLQPDGQILYSAAAEAIASTFADGPCVGALVGVISPEGKVGPQRPLERCVKVEGISLDPAHPGELLLVADADERAQPAMLYRARL